MKEKIAMQKFRTCSHRNWHASFRQILPMTASKFLEIHEYSCGIFPCPPQNLLENLRTIPMRTSSNFVACKAKFCRNMVIFQKILTHDVFSHLPKAGARMRRHQSKWRNEAGGKICRKDVCRALCEHALNWTGIQPCKFFKQTFRSCKWILY